MPWFKVKVVYGNEHALHRDPRGLHVERPERLQLAIEGLSELLSSGYASIVGLPEPDINSALFVHEDYYAEFIRRESSKGFHYNWKPRLSRRRWGFLRFVCMRYCGEEPVWGGGLMAPPGPRPRGPER